MNSYLTKAKSYTELHHLTYSDISKTAFLPSDIIQEALKDVWAKRKTIKNEFNKCSIRLNRRWFKFFVFETERRTPCFRITYSPRNFFVIPVKLDRGYKRSKEFLDEDWEIKSIYLLDGKIAVSLEKEFS